MSEVQIGRRRRVADIRSIWRKEPDFSDWLISEVGLEVLAEDVGLALENVQRECRPGDFPCDVVGTLLGDENHVVVIENQYGRTNHDHLGKLLTYAASHKAMTGIWIAEHVSDDHRAVIDWLNDNTPPNINFYLCELKAYQIGNSPVSPQLDLVCRPNASAKIQRERSESDRERDTWRKSFWEEIHAYVAAAKPPFRFQKPGIDHWSSIAVGRSGFSLNLLLTPKNQSIGIELYISVDGWKESAFEQLQAGKDEIEKEVGVLQWMPLPGKKSARILLEARIDPKDPTQRQAVKEWFAEKSIIMHRVFRERVLSLAAVE